MVKILEDLKTADNKQKILDSINNIESEWQILKQIVPTFYSEEDMED